MYFYLNFRWDEKSCGTNKLKFITFNWVPLKEMIKKFHTKVQSLVVQFKTLLNFHQPVHQYGSHLRSDVFLCFHVIC